VAHVPAEEVGPNAARAPMTRRAARRCRRLQQHTPARGPAGLRPPLRHALPSRALTVLVSLTCSISPPRPRPRSWILLGLDAADKKKLTVVASGRCGLDKMKRSITDDAILFGAFRVYAVEAAIKQPRFISFVWTGRAAPLKAKVGASNLKAAALKWFDVSGGLGFSKEERVGSCRLPVRIPHALMPYRR
jgi:hypothetical protein